MASDVEYDCKFEEMKKYIPFLENMITRLESNNKSTAGNPRQAQLDKIRSLRDLLLDTKKRMKMENLLKCEQVLVNLYAKVENQKEKQPATENTSPESKNSNTFSETKPDLDLARNKLKTLVQRELQSNPEIQGSFPKDREPRIDSSPGGWENALYQRRTSPKRRSPIKHPGGKADSTTIKRNYTRVLVSPEPSSRRWPSSDRSPEQLYSRRSAKSPSRSSRRSSKRSSRSSTSYRLEKRKSSKLQSKSDHKDLNITLNVPEGSLESLNTTDLVSRIINCSDSDVDISTLRELRSQILGELKQTGAPDDISDLILQSYRNKKGTKVKPEVEEGELSDSESEAIERVYGNLVLKNKDNCENKHQNSKSAESSRKIQINLVINPDKGKQDVKPLTEDLSDCEIIDDVHANQSTEISSSQDSETVSNLSQKNYLIEKDKISKCRISGSKEVKLIKITPNIESDVISLDEDENEVKDACQNQKHIVTIINETAHTQNELKERIYPSPKNKIQEKSQLDALKITNLIEQNRMPYKEVAEVSQKSQRQNLRKENVCKADSNESENIEDNFKNNDIRSSKKPNSANFYKPLSSENEITNENQDISEHQKTAIDTSSVFNDSEKSLSYSNKCSIPETNVNDPKRETQNSSKSAITDNLSTDSMKTVAGIEHESNTFKTTNVLVKNTIDKCINEFGTRKKSSEKIPLLNENPETSLQMDVLQALKNEILNEPLSLSGSDNFTPALHQPKVSKVANVTEIMPKKKISIESYKKKTNNKMQCSDDARFAESHGFSSREEYRQSLKLTEKERERFKDFFSKLPHYESSDEEVNSITADDVYADLAPESPDKNPTEVYHNPKLIPEDPINEKFSPRVPLSKNSKDIDMRAITSVSISSPGMHKHQIRPTDPRLKKAMSSSFASGSPNPYATPQRTPVEPVPLLNFPNMTPIRTPNARTYEMTPSHQTVDIEESSRKHVYAPCFSTADSNDYREQSLSRDIRKSPEPEIRSRWNRESREVSVQRKFDTQNFRMHRNQDEYKNQSIRNEHYEKRPNQSSYSLEHPMTPLPSFGRVDCPTTPSHPFGRSDCPTTPIHPFGRSDCPLTPSHPFGRSDCQTTPSHPFGRSDCPTTPSHPFGRSDCPTTPSHPFGRECPTTPSHPFGQSEQSNSLYSRADRPMTPGHTFGRSDYSIPQSSAQQTFRGRANDPRLTRMTSTSHNYHDIDNNRSSYGDQNFSSDRRSSYIEPYRTQYSGTDYRQFNNNKLNAREQSMGRIQRDQSVGRNFREQSVGQNPRTKSIGRPGDREYTESGSYHNKAYDRRDPNLGYNVLTTQMETQHIDNNRNAQSRQRGRSVGRSILEEKILGSASRGTSVGRILNQKDSTLSVTQHAGSSFTIDTSITATFQGMHTFNSDFNAKRQRAASVGRSLVREPSMLKTTIKKRPPLLETPNCPPNKNFRRAASVGRELLEINTKSFHQIKAEFERYVESRREENLDSQFKEKRKNRSTVKETDRPSRRAIYESERDKKAIRSNTESRNTSKGNYKDPRLRREQKYFDRNRHTNIKNSHRDHKNKNNCGIVYTNDNIARGNILGPGYGVKNYKIPKIKRPTPPPTEENKKVSQKSHEAETDNSKKELENKKPIANISILNNNQSELYPPKNGKGKDEKTDEIVEIPRKYKKAVIEDSASDEENALTNISNEPESALKVEADKHPLIDSSNEATEISFGIDDIGMLTDPVLDNINDLIAELDNDLNSSEITKTETETQAVETKEGFRNNMSQETLNKDSSDVVLNEIAEFIEQDLESQSTHNLNTTKGMDASSKKDEILTEKDDETTQSTLSESQIHQIESMTVKNTLSKPSESIVKKTSENEQVFVHSIQTDQACESAVNQTSCQNVTENVVSTTISSLNKNKSIFENESYQKLDLSLDGSSTPDSTINNEGSSTFNTQQRKSPSSLIPLAQSDMNSDITSTHDPCKQDKKQSAELIKDEQNKNYNDSQLGNLLSMLQDKTKIKSLLSMLDDNDKIKKKLAKLSEIVSDDEETNENKDVQELSTSNKEPESEPCSDPDAKKIESVLNTDNKETPTDYKPEINTIENKLMGDAKIEISNKEVGKTFDSDQKVRKTAKKTRKKNKNQPIARNQKRLTRSEAAAKKKKNLSRELKFLQDDIKEMFMTNANDLNDTGLRMCRLAKLVEEKVPQKDVSVSNTEPVVILQKVSTTDVPPQSAAKIRKKPGPKPKVKVIENVTESPNVPKVIKYKPGPKSKKQAIESDPYAFDTDTYSETNTSNISERVSETESDSDNDSVASSKSSESNEPLVELKKKKRRRKCAWNSGIIKPRSKKNKAKVNFTESAEPPNKKIVDDKINSIPDIDCFTDIEYCFRQNVTTYSCRLCFYSGNDIVHHYRRNHPHSEIPLSRIDPETAKIAIQQCEEISIPAISKIPTERYICRFCYKAFVSKRKAVLEEFFWHVVSTHTGEYKQLCSECINVTRCPFNLDIPPPPKDASGQLIGYICGKCNFTQISLENLKNHVIERHNDEQTEVYNINLAVMTQKTITALSKRCKLSNRPRVLRSAQSNQSFTEDDEQRPDVIENSGRSETDSTTVSKTNTFNTKEPIRRSSVQSRLSFQPDVNISQNSPAKFVEAEVKIEKDAVEENIMDNDNEPESTSVNDKDKEKESDTGFEDDVVRYPHFKIDIKVSGIKEYVCCINGQDSHYKTSLLISMKKHIKIKHIEKWDGYCFACKVIVTPQGHHPFVDCLQHYLDQHIDSFPVLEKESEQFIPAIPEPEALDVGDQRAPTPKTYINVRPMSELISNETSSSALPMIESVVSIGSSAAPSQPSPNYPPQHQIEPSPEKEYKYEETQAKIMSKKHRVVLDSMMSHTKLIQVFKCAGRFCSFTTDSVEDALVHASTHLRVGGENSLNCAYCDFDATGNAIDLVMHVFKSHGDCHFACEACFYRASASQLVGAHIRRVHSSSSSVKVLRNAVAPPPRAEENLDLVPREVAVPLYTCRTEPQCDFETYTPESFIEHFLMKHPNATTYPCSLCSTLISSKDNIIHHLRSHGIQRYQCPRCFHGADDEEALLGHASARHPNRPPQAYMRIITADKRVLPLANLDSTTVTVTDVQPSYTSEDAAKEAEKSIDLEKLIGPTSQLFGSAPAATPSSVEIVSSATLASQLLKQLGERTNTSDLAVLSDVSAVEPAREEHPRLDTPIQENATITQVTTPIIKKEPVDDNFKQNVIVDIVCLDSDDEEVPDVINLSDDEKAASAPASVEKPKPGPSMSRKNLQVLCPICLSWYSYGPGFMSHLRICNIDPGQPIQCLYCPFKTEKRDTFVAHFQECYPKHAKITTNYHCAICKLTSKDIAYAKRHMKIHGIAENALTVVANKDSEGRLIFIVDKKQKAKETKKRQKSSEAVDSSKTTNQSFEPKDIHLLPIQPIFDKIVNCALCGFNTKVRTNMIRHLESHSNQQPVSQTVPVNPVPHLETNEMHFDRMVNLASSSLTTSKPKDAAAAPLPTVPPETASRYPKYVPDRQRHTCGAKDCSYISSDEAMLKCHWETLHNGSSEYRCVHCPPYQQLDTSRPLTAGRIVAHLKMHDATLYACSNCPYYHYKKTVVEKHVNENHNKKALVMIVRDESIQTQHSSSYAPTMDLKPWQCGLCQFKSMIRPEVAEHCAKSHQSKMQFKCTYCPFRTSTLENVTKHQGTAHVGRKEEVFYFYYREGSIPDEDGKPLWSLQRERIGYKEPAVKVETEAPLVPVAPVRVELPAVVPVDPNIRVKQEVDDESSGLSVNAACVTFGGFGEPKGLKFCCPLCKVFTEDTKEGMQSHLFEELKYRRWSCRLCAYKAYHPKGFEEHFKLEHKLQLTPTNAPIQLPDDPNIELWVSTLLDQQSAAIEEAKQTENKTPITATVEAEKPTPTPLVVPSPSKTSKEFTETRLAVLEQAFGPLGEPTPSGQFNCPKCGTESKDEDHMIDHLESELSAIRWTCSVCDGTFQQYHTAQYHCRTSHPGQSCKPIPAEKDPIVRADWVQAVIAIQKKKREKLEKQTPTSSLKEHKEIDDNSLLVPIFEKDIPVPDIRVNSPIVTPQKRSAPADSDSEDERLVIDDILTSKKRLVETVAPEKVRSVHKCQYCDFKTKERSYLGRHILRHYKLKTYICDYCGYNGDIQNFKYHFEIEHPGMPPSKRRTEIPSAPPVILKVPTRKRKGLKKTPTSDDEDDVSYRPSNKSRAKRKKSSDDGTKASFPSAIGKTSEEKLICFVCLKAFTLEEASTHEHMNNKVEFGKRGDIVLKCTICQIVLKTIDLMREHCSQLHPNETFNYAYLRLHYDDANFLSCGYCQKSFKMFTNLIQHNSAVHRALPLKYHEVPFPSSTKAQDTTFCISSGEKFNIPSNSQNRDSTNIYIEEDPNKRQQGDNPMLTAPPRIAKKSTTKLPISTSIAKKSTTKLPLEPQSEASSDLSEEFSYYGEKPSDAGLETVTAYVPVNETVMPLQYNQVDKVVKINPVVLVDDLKKAQNQ